MLRGSGSHVKVGPQDSPEKKNSNILRQTAMHSSGHIAVDFTALLPWYRIIVLEMQIVVLKLVGLTRPQKKEKRTNSVKKKAHKHPCKQNHRPATLANRKI